MNKKRIGAIVIGAILVGAIVFTALSTTRIDNGHVGVIYSMNGGVQDDVKTQGWRWIGVGNKAIEYSIRTQQLYMSKDKNEGSEKDDSLNIGTQGGSVNVDFEMSYSFNAETVPNVYKKYGGLSGEDIVNNIVRGRIRGLINEVTSKYTVAEIYIDKREEVNNAITDHLKAKLVDTGIIVERATLPEVRPAKSVIEALEVRSKVAQELENEKQKQEKTTLEAETKRIEAQGEADKKLIQAEAEAKANRVIQESLTPELIEKMRIEKWNGSNANTVVNGSDPKVVVPTE